MVRLVFHDEGILATGQVVMERRVDRAPDDDHRRRALSGQNVALVQCVGASKSRMRHIQCDTRRTCPHRTGSNSTGVRRSVSLSRVHTRGNRIGRVKLTLFQNYTLISHQAFKSDAAAVLTEALFWLTSARMFVSRVR